MSVINQMLRDLDKREPGLDVEIPLPVSQYVQQLERQPDKLWSVGVVFLALLVAAGVWRYYPVIHERLTGTQINDGASVALPMDNDRVSVQVNDSQQTDIVNTIPTEKMRPQPAALAELQLLPDKHMDEISHKAASRRNEVINGLVQPEFKLKLQTATEIVTAVESDKFEHQPDATEIITAVESDKFGHQPAVKPVSYAGQAEAPQINITNRASTREQHARKQRAHSKQLILAGSRQAGIQALKDVLLLDSELTEAREYLITLLMQQNDASALEPWLEDGLRNDPQNEVFVTARSRLLAAQGDYQQAIVLLVSVIEAGNNSENIHAALAAIYQQTGDFVASAKIYNQLLTANPGQAGWWLGFAISLENLGQTAAAVESYQRAADVGQLQPNLIEYARQRMIALKAM